MGIWTSIKHMIPWAHPGPQPNGTSIGSPVFARAKTDEAIGVPFGLYFATFCPFPPQNYPLE